jgi:transketolase
MREAMTQDWKNNKLDPSLKSILSDVANTIRGLAMDATQKANSGHPGMPMGCAEIGAYLYGHALRQNPKDSHWLNRDRFILSAGHGSMFLYACLHMAGYKLSMEEIKNFRQLHSQTPGHPESFETDGVETTTGPLGQGFGNAVGQALGIKLLADKFNTEKRKIFDGKVYCIAGDGCIMEGITSEVSSLAGHLKINNLIVIYDANNITLDGTLDESFSEDTKMRYKAYGWDVYEIDGHDLDSIHAVITHIKADQQRPCLIYAHTVIGKGAPNKAGTHKAHGSPLGEDEVKAAKALLGLPETPFYVPQKVYDFFSSKLIEDAKLEKQWNDTLQSWAQENPERYSDFQKMRNREIPKDLEQKLQALEIKAPIAGRKASQDVLNFIADLLPQLYGGSADLSGSDLTWIKKYPPISPGLFVGRNIKYGVREFGMACIATGLAQTQMIVPYIGTFLTFSDYMRNAIRLASLEHQQVIYQFTHDSIFLGEDGPTHQPVEHLASLRAMPNLHVIRPADSNEVKMSWIAALLYEGPTAIVLSRQNLPDFAETKRSYAEGVGRGAYILKKENAKPDFTLIATGSEVSLAMDVAQELEKLGKQVRVISMPCWEIFERQPTEYKASLFGGNIGKRVSIEAGVENGWHKYIGIDGIAIALSGYGASAPQKDLAKEFGFTKESIIKKIL